DEGITWLSVVVGMFAISCRFARYAFDPLPHLRCLIEVGVQDQMRMHRLSNLPFNLAPCYMRGDTAVLVRRTDKSHHSTLFSDGSQGICRPIHDNFELSHMKIPAEFFDKQDGKVELFE